jgi:ribosomal protein S18 acetylase RimI-like enzyme
MRTSLDAVGWTRGYFSWMRTLDIIPLATSPSREALIPSVVEWIVDASEPYLGWLLGGDLPARIGRWMRRPSSEVAFGRVSVARDEAAWVGGFVAMDGRTLSACRISDAVAALEEAGDEVEAVRGRMEIGRSLFPAVDRDDFYLSRVGLLERYRGRGLGESLVASYLKTGEAQGFERFRLDVSAWNDRALSLFRRMGFHPISESTLPGTTLAYVAMVRG